MSLAINATIRIFTVHPAALRTYIVSLGVRSAILISPYGRGSCPVAYACRGSWEALRAHM